MLWRSFFLGTVLALCLLIVTPVVALEASAARGRAFARENCARCHAVDTHNQSSMREAPPFRMLAKRFPIDDLADVLVEGVEQRHPAMPEFRLDPGDAADLTSYLKTLRR